ncbi:MFS transporter [Protaetiibacter intestinalis]|uniref:MFS transporter n=1 Tax=Protaetiibacter intestinalis TaxID=2419774 RepID=A0A387BLU4_9MICO|nr:MFS transporter [Protaetiibacter intestinalis]
MRTPRRRFQLRLALIVALGVFAQETVWNFHDSQTPVTLAGYTTSVALIGLIMGLDNIIGIFVQPLMGFFSDRTRSRLGRRTPYILVGVPVAALLFVLIPLVPSFPILIVVIVLFSLTANSFKPIAEALLADQQPPEHRSKANAIGRFASGLTIIVSALLSLFVVDRSVELAYVISAGVMVVCFVILALTLRESRTVAYRAVLDEDAAQGRETTGFFAVFRDIFTDRDRSRLFMILAIVVTWGAWAAVRALLTLYGVEQLGLTRGEAGGLTLPASVAFLLVIIPVAIVSDRFGRRRVMRIGIVVFALGALVAFLFNDSLTATLVGILIAAAGFAGFAANAAVMLWNLAPSQRLIGVYTGIFAVAQAVGSSAGPAALGGLVDLTDWHYLMLFLVVMSLLGLLITFGVRREYAPGQLVEESKAADAEPVE